MTTELKQLQRALEPDSPFVSVTLMDRNGDRIAFVVYADALPAIAHLARESLAREYALSATTYWPP